MTKPAVHLVSNAHLDPVWSWPWDEGLVEALATFRIALNFLDQYPEYVFVRGESLLYEWIETHDPATFARMREQIQAGRWVIVGGWYLQPDCNLPGGESFVRQALIGKSYFMEKFGADPQVAYNVDSFGHNGGLPQILRLSGSTQYIHFRPEAHEVTLPEIYRWKGVDGTEIITARPLLAGYCTEPGLGPQKTLKGVARARQTGKDVLLFWGVGDHGGGATRLEMDEIRTIIAQTTDVDIRHSSPPAFFDSYLATASDLPVVTGDLQHCFTGCYTSAASLKRTHRQTEGLLAQAERLASLAYAQSGGSYPQADLQTAWKDLLFAEFHDSLAGTTSKAALQDLLQILGRSQQIARKVRLGAALQLAASQQQVSGAIPIHVFNPHTFHYSGPVNAEFMLDYRPPDWSGNRVPVTVIAPDGRQAPSQEGVPTFIFPLDWRKNLSFWAEIPPLSSTLYLVQRSQLETPPTTAFSVAQTETALVVENGQLQFTFDRQTGLLRRLSDLATNRDILMADGICPLVMADPGDTWGTSISAYRNLAGVFHPASPPLIARLSGHPGTSSPAPALRLVEHGPLRVVVDSLLEFGASSLVARWTIYPDRPFFTLDLKIDWREPNHFLKLSVPTTLRSRNVSCEVPYGAIQRPADGTEQVGQRWVLLGSGEATLGVVNTGQYGFDALDGELRLSLLRSPQYSALSFGTQIAQLEPYPDFMDIGLHEISLAFSFGPSASNLAETIRIAQQTSVPAVVLPYFQLPEGQSPEVIQPQPAFLSVEPATIVLGALKLAQDSRGLIIRLHESGGDFTQAQLTFGTGQAASIPFSPYQIQSFRWFEGILQPCDLLERPL